MIITGYQGIGKSTLASKYDKIIDLESSSFWKTEEVYGIEKRTRPDDWHIYYCQVAMHLSSQGYIVFVSSHAEVRKFLGFHNPDCSHYCAIYPYKKVKEDWLKKLKDRYLDSNSDKDLRAYEFAVNNYDQSTYDMWYESQYGEEYYKAVKIIEDINYNLEDLVKELYKSVYNEELVL